MKNALCHKRLVEAWESEDGNIFPERLGAIRDSTRSRLHSVFDRLDYSTSSYDFINTLVDDILERPENFVGFAKAIMTYATEKGYEKK